MQETGPSPPFAAPEGRRRRSWRARAGLLVAGLASGVLLLEVGVRILAPCAVFGCMYEPPQKQFFQYDALLGWKGRPHAHGEFASIEFRTRVSLDENGFRSQGSPFAEGKRNILALGDSYAWGWGVDDADVFSELMNASDPSINVYNLAAPGYGPDQSFLTLEAFVRQRRDSGYEEAVLLLFIDNDFEDVGATARYTFPKPRFSIENDGLVLNNVPVPDTRRAYYDNRRQPIRAGEVGLSWLNSSHLYNRLGGARRVVERARESMRTVWMVEAQATAPPHDAAVREEVMCGVLRAFQALTDDCRMSFSVLLLVQDAHDRLPIVRTMLDDQGTPHGTFEVEAFPPRRLCVDPHLTPYGNRLLAEAVAALLGRDGEEP